MLKNGSLLVLMLVSLGLVGCPPSGVVRLTVNTVTLEVGQSFTLGANSSNSADAPFSWTVDNPEVITLDANIGLSVRLTALNPGSAKVTVTGAKSGASATATIIVPTPAPEDQTSHKITITPVSGVLEVGNTLSISADSTSPDDTDFVWEVSHNTIASLSSTTGADVELTALSPGVTTVSVTGVNSGAKATAVFSVISREDGSFGNPLLPGGLKITITDVLMPEDRRPEVTFIAVNDRGDVVPFVELTTIQFLIAYLDTAPAPGDSASYISYNTRVEAPAGLAPASQATYDSAGRAGVSVGANGTLLYKFAIALPESINIRATHAVGGQFRRTSALDGKVYVDNAVYEFRPDGNAVVETRDIVETASCNTCHTRLSFHGDVRRDVRLCILCHNPGTTDANTGNTVDMRVMIHKIHLGVDLPSVQDGEPYQIIGFGNAVHDYSSVAYPQDIRNCTSCHKQDTGASQADYYLTKPTQAACGSCHDRTWFGDPAATPEGYRNHPFDFVQQDDRQCATCHTPQAPGVAPILEAHRTVAELPGNPGLNLEIAQISTNAEDGTLAIDFTARYGDGSPITDLMETANVGAVVAWPSWEYENYYSESIRGSANLTSNTSATGEYTYTFANKLPTVPGMSFGIVMTGRVRFDVGGVTQTQGLAGNSLTYFTIDGSTPHMRRLVADESHCNNCHHELRGHGEQRIGVDSCVMCHHTTATDIARRPPEAMPAATINFKDMIHRIHRGSGLENGYTAYGFGNILHDFSHVHFPGRLEQCSVCHGENSVNLPLPEVALPTIAGDSNPVLPERAACVSCHDGIMPNIHAVLATDAASGIESCVVCHGAGAPQAVAMVHALAP